MAAAKVVFHPVASEDYVEAFAWYYSRGVTLASDFEREIDRIIHLISQNPLRWPRFDTERRRLLVRKFPYSVIYEPQAKKFSFSPSHTANENPTIGVSAR